MNELSVYYNLCSVATRLRELKSLAGSVGHNAAAIDQLADEVESVGLAILASRKVEVPSQVNVTEPGDAGGPRSSE